MIRFSTLALLALATPLGAQTPAAPTAPVAPAQPDPARQAAAQRVINRLWPLGTYRRLMDGTMSQMIDTMMDQMYAMKASDVDPTATGEAGEQTMGKAIAAEDPHFRERMQLSTKAMFDAMLPLMDKIEPSVRDSMVKIYARKFSASDLQAMEAFFATPAGQTYAREWLLSFMDPEIMKGMQAFAPGMMREMPAIMKKVEAATAHLPPAPKKKVSPQ